jgi:hypothetical protein
MKKSYLIICSLALSLAATAQTDHVSGFTQGSVRPLVQSSSPETGERAGQDTTGIGFNVLTTFSFLPEFAPNGQVVSFTLGTGYVFGNNPYAINVCAQGYQNLNATPVSVVGAIVWFTAKRSSGASGPSSKVVVKAWNMAPNKARNTDGAGGSAVNSMGPATGITAPAASGNLLFADIDTNFLADNYVPFAAAATFGGDFAVGVDSRTNASTGLIAGDTVGILADQVGDAANLDYSFVFYSSQWYVADYLFSAAGSGDADNDIAIFAVFSDATGVDQYFNGMKLTAYPNPSVERATIEYTLEKNSNNVSLVVTDIKGRVITENKYASQSAGTYKMDVETGNLAAGTYFYRLIADGHDFTKKFVVNK